MGGAIRAITRSSTGKKNSPLSEPGFEVFAESWSKSRSLFREKISSIGGVYEEIPLESRGPQDGLLTIGIGLVSFKDGVVVPPKDELFDNLILHIAGVHGVEGFAGCATQLSWLDAVSESPSKHRKNLPNHTAVFINGVNPWGMSWLRRSNANNVDLNRNAVDFAGPLPNSDSYESIHPILLDTSWRDVFWLPRLVWIAIKKGTDFLTQALTGGQYVEPKGFYFGGKVWQSELIFVKRYLETRFSHTKHVFAIDVHTGLGPFGQESLFTHDSVSENEIQNLSKKLGLKISYNEVDGKTSYHANGGFAGVVFLAFPSARVDYLLQEFGTFSGFQVLAGLYYEHHRWLRGTFGPGVSASESLKSLFFPTDFGWRRNLLVKSRELLDRVQKNGFQ